MGSVQNIVSALKTTIQGVATGYSELAYAKDISKNTFKDSQKKFGVIPKEANETNGTLGFLTFEQSFEIILTNGFINKPMTDSEEQTKSIELQDLAQSIYKQIGNTKAGLPGTVIMVSDLRLEPSETSDQKIVIQRGTFNIKYKLNL